MRISLHRRPWAPIAFRGRLACVLADGQCRL